MLAKAIAMMNAFRMLKSPRGEYRHHARIKSRARRPFGGQNGDICFVGHAIEADFASQMTAATIVTVPASKPISAIAGSSTNIATLRDAQHHGYRMRAA